MTSASGRGSGVPSILPLIFFLIFTVPVSLLPEKGGDNSRIHSGKLLQMFKSGGYTYLEYESDGEKFWAASKTVVANIGNTIEFRNPLAMKDFYSKSLKRKFDLIYFAGMVRAVGKSGGLSPDPSNGMMGGKYTGTEKKAVEVLTGSIKKADGGMTIEECYSKKDELDGKVVLIRAKVVRFSPNIRGTNWVHIRDGSGGPGSNDITFTTMKTLIPGDMVLLKGKLLVNKDIGSGYKFPVFMEDPEIVKERE